MWFGDKYIYSKSLLRNIAKYYPSIYEGLEISWRYDTCNLEWIAGAKADFDMALNRLGHSHRSKKYHWTGELYPFSYYKHFSRLQQIIIADILGEENLSMFYNPGQLRSQAYTWMIKFLNRDPHKICKANDLQDVVYLKGTI